ncbi:MAG: FAD-dependent oxidoreductase, partial [Prosthecobacter sp.]
MGDSVDVLCKPDVLVIGAGSAGVAAGIAAARQGAEVLLVEGGGILGGAGTAALVHSFCGLYDLRESDAEPLKLANKGLPVELEHRLREEGIGARRRMGRVDVLLHSPQRLAAFYDRWCSAEDRLRLLLHTSVIAAKVESDRVSEVTLHCRGTSMHVRPKAVVDASGDAVLAALSGHAFELAPSHELLRPAYCVGIAGAGQELPVLELAAMIVRNIQDGSLPQEAAGAQFRQLDGGQVFLTLDLPGDQAYDSTSAVSLSAVELAGRSLVFQIFDCLRREHAAFRQAW